MKSNHFIAILLSLAAIMLLGSFLTEIMTQSIEVNFGETQHKLEVIRNGY